MHIWVGIDIFTRRLPQRLRSCTATSWDCIVLSQCNSRGVWPKFGTTVYFIDIICSLDQADTTQAWQRRIRSLILPAILISFDSPTAIMRHPIFMIESKTDREVVTGYFLIRTELKSNCSTKWEDFEYLAGWSDPTLKSPMKKDGQWWMFCLRWCGGVEYTSRLRGLTRSGQLRRLEPYRLWNLGSWILRMRSFFIHTRRLWDIYHTEVEPVRGQVYLRPRSRSLRWQTTYRVWISHP